MERVEPPLAGDERTMLRAFLDFLRATILIKCDGLDADQLATTTAATTMTLGGLLKHLTVVERSWFVEDMLGEPLGEPWDAIDWEADRDWEWHSAVDDDPDELRAMYAAACERSREVEAGLTDLDARSVATDRTTGEHYTLRWVMVHMIEETARHAGHADLLREAVDGSVGQ